MEIWNRSFTSTVRRTFPNNPSQKRSFTKTFFKRRNLKTLAFHFSVHGLTHFKSESFRKQRPHKNDVILLARVFLQHKFKVNNRIIAFLDSSTVVRTEKIDAISVKPLLSYSCGVTCATSYKRTIVKTICKFVPTSFLLPTKEQL